MKPQTHFRPWKVTRGPDPEGDTERKSSVVRVWDPDGHEMIVMYICGGPTDFHAQHLAERITQVGAPVFDGRPYVVAGDEGASELVQLMAEKAFAISPKVGVNRV